MKYIIMTLIMVGMVYLVFTSPGPVLGTGLAVFLGFSILGELQTLNKRK